MENKIEVKEVNKDIANIIDKIENKRKITKEKIKKNKARHS